MAKHEDKADDYIITPEGNILLQALLFKKNELEKASDKTFEELCDMLDKYLPDERDGRETLLYTKKQRGKIMALKKYVETIQYYHFKNEGYGKTKWTSDMIILDEIGVKEAIQMEVNDAIVINCNGNQMLTMYKNDILLFDINNKYSQIVSKENFDKKYIANAVGREQRFWPQDFECLYENYIYATQFNGKMTKDIADLLISEKYRYDKKEPVRKRIDMISNDIDEGNFLIKQEYRFSTMEEGYFKSRYKEVKEEPKINTLQWTGNNLEEIADELAGYCIVSLDKNKKIKVQNIRTKKANKAILFGIGDEFEVKTFKTTCQIKEIKDNGN